MEIMDQVYFGNTVWQWSTALVIAVVTLAVLRIVRSVIARRLKQLAERTETNIDDLVIDLLGGTKFIILLALSLYVGTLWLTLPASARQLLNSAAVIVFLFQAAFWGNSVITFSLSAFLQRRADDAVSTTMISAVGMVAKVVFFALLVLVALGTLGFDVTAIVTLGGIGGIAAALAVQNILGDLFSSLSIVMDRPFVIGDFITVGEFMGTVEHIGLKSTRIRSNTGEQIVIGNSDLLSSRLRNFKRMTERRGTFTIGVTYDTLHEKLAAIPSMIQEIIDANEMTRFDRAHFSQFADSSLNFDVVYWVTTAAYADFVGAQQQINLAIHRRFTEEGIEMAFPTRTIYVEKEGAQAA